MKEWLDLMIITYIIDISVLLKINQENEHKVKGQGQTNNYDKNNLPINHKQMVRS